MLKEDLQFAVSSISCSEYNPLRLHQIAIPIFATEQTVRRATFLREALGPIFGYENISVSLHLASIIKIPEAIEMFKNAGISISSIDTPDIFPNRQLLREIIESLKIKNLRELLLNIGFRLQNVGSKEEYWRKLAQGLSLREDLSQIQIVRANAEAWNNSTLGSELRRELNKIDNVALAVEINARDQTPAEYLDFIKALTTTNDKTSVCMDIDLGHLAESRFLHQGRSEIPDALEVFERILEDPHDSHLVAITTLNQYTPGDRHTHTNLVAGPINLVEATGKIGKAAGEDRLSYNPMVLTEFYPFEFNLLIDPEGLAFCRRLRTVYDSTRFSH